MIPSDCLPAPQTATRELVKAMFDRLGFATFQKIYRDSSPYRPSSRSVAETTTAVTGGIVRATRSEGKDCLVVVIPHFVGSKALAEETKKTSLLAVVTELGRHLASVGVSPFPLTKCVLAARVFKTVLLSGGVFIERCSAGCG